MTWGKASPVLVISVVFDAVRFMFTWFIFFGPALTSLYCTIKGSSTAVGSFFGTAAVETACGVGVIAAGVVGAGAIETFGIVMAMVTGFAGWFAILIIFLIFNARIFKGNALWFGGSLLLSEIPFINSLPALTVTVWKMYHTQIRIEKAERGKWEKENAAAQAQERQWQELQLQHYQAAQMAEAEAANDAVYAQAANDEEIPEEVREAA